MDIIDYVNKNWNDETGCTFKMKAGSIIRNVFVPSWNKHDYWINSKSNKTLMFRGSSKTNESISELVRYSEGYEIIKPIDDKPKALTVLRESYNKFSCDMENYFNEIDGANEHDINFELMTIQNAINSIIGKVGE